MRESTPAVTTIRGFHSPVCEMSGDGDTRFDSRSPSRRAHKLDDVVSANSSPMLRSISSSGLGGISKLKLQLDTINSTSSDLSRNSSFVHHRHLPHSPPESIATSEAFSDDDLSDTTTYEVPLAHDFISEGACDKPLDSVAGGADLTLNGTRKVTAANFEPLRCLGKGTFGTVLLVKQQTTGRLFAQKQFKKASLIVHKRLIQQTKTERSILESVNRHPFVVKLFYAFQDQEKLYLILEYAQGGELFTHLAQERMFSEDVASFYMAEMVLALEHLHRNLGVVYRDLKPENCLLDADGHLLLTDFGLSKVAVDEDDKCNSMLGTVEYMAPEVILGQKYGMAVDWWSLGALGYDLLTGSPPFQGQNHAKIQERIVKQKLAIPYFLSPDAKDLLTRLLRKEPAKRLGANMPRDLQTIKKHRFFRKIDWKALANREIQAPIQPLITDPELAENFSNEFTELALSPVLSSHRSPLPTSVAPLNASVSGGNSVPMVKDNPFGGFSYVASQSLLESDDFMAMARGVAI